MAFFNICEECKNAICLVGAKNLLCGISRTKAKKSTCPYHDKGLPQVKYPKDLAKT